MQELAEGIKQLLDMVTYHMLTAGDKLPVPFANLLPLLAAMAEAWAAYSSSETADAVANAAPDAGETASCDSSLDTAHAHRES